MLLVSRIPSFALGLERHTDLKRVTQAGKSVDLTFSETANLRLFQDGRVCRRQLQFFIKMAEGFPKEYKKKVVGKEDITCYKQCLLFPQCSKRLLLQTRKIKGFFRKGLTTNFNIA